MTSPTLDRALADARRRGQRAEAEMRRAHRARNATDMERWSAEFMRALRDAYIAIVEDQVRRLDVAPTHFEARA